MNPSAGHTNTPRWQPSPNMGNNNENNKHFFIFAITLAAIGAISWISYTGIQYVFSTPPPPPIGIDFKYNMLPDIIHGVQMGFLMNSLPEPEWQDLMANYWRFRLQFPEQRIVDILFHNITNKTGLTFTNLDELFTYINNLPKRSVRPPI